MKVNALRGGEQFDTDDTSGVIHHAQQPARGMGCHADVIFLIRRGGNRVDAAGGGERLVLGNQRGRGDLRDHEAGVHAAVVDQKWRQPAHLRVHEDGDAPLRQAPYLGNRQRKRVCGKCHRLGVKIAAGQDISGVCEQQWVVRDGIGFNMESGGDAADQIEAGAHDLRLAAKRIRILHPGAIDVRCAYCAAGHQLQVFAGDGDLARLPARRVNTRIKRRITPLEGVDRHRARDHSAGEQILGAKESGECERGRYLRAIDQREPFLGAELEGLQAGRFETLRCILGFAVDAYLANPEQHGAQVRERRQVARRADRALRGNDRIYLPVKQCEQSVDQLIADARQTLCQCIDLQREDQANDGVGQRLADAGGMRHQ